jgi:hypothetical protein
VFVVHVIPPLKLITKRSPDGMLFLAVFPVTDSFNVDSVNWHGSTKVNINIPASVASNPSFQVDGSGTGCQPSDGHPESIQSRYCHDNSGASAFSSPDRLSKSLFVYYQQ